MAHDINRRDRAYPRGGDEEKGSFSLIQGLSINNHWHANSNHGSIKSIETVQFRWMCTTNFAPLGPKSNCNMLKCHAATLRFIHTILTAGFGYNMVVRFLYTNSAGPCRMAIWNQWFTRMFVKCRSKEKFRDCDVLEKNEHMVFETSMKWHKANWNQWHEKTNAQISEWTTKEKNWCMLACRKKPINEPMIKWVLQLCWKIPVLKRTLHIVRTNSRIYIILKRAYKHIPYPWYAPCRNWIGRSFAKTN